MVLDGRWWWTDEYADCDCDADADRDCDCCERRPRRPATRRNRNLQLLP